MQHDPYTVLGVPRGAPEADVTKAYRKLAMQWHPDRNQGNKAAEEKFKEIGAAYEAIKSGAADQPRMPPGFDPFGHAPWRKATPHGMRDPVEEMLHAFRAHHVQRNRDIHLNYSITMEDAFHGRDLDITLNLPTEKREIKIKLPPGVETGMHSRVPGAGERVWPGVQPGDAIITFHIAQHPRFAREKANLHLELPVSVFDALLGTEVEVAGIDGAKLKVAVPSCARHGLKLRLPGHGMPDMRAGGRRGDLILTVTLSMPTSLTPEQRTVLEGLPK